MAKKDIPLIGIVCAAQSISAPHQHFCARSRDQFLTLGFRHQQQIDFQFLMFDQAVFLDQPGQGTIEAAVKAAFADDIAVMFGEQR